MKKIAIITNQISWVFSGGAKGGGASVVAKNFILELMKNNQYEITIFSSPVDFIVDANFNCKIIWIDKPFNTAEYIDEIDKYSQIENFDFVFNFCGEVAYKNTFLQSHTFQYRCKKLMFPINYVMQVVNRKKIKKQKTFMTHNHSKYCAVSEIIKNDYVDNIGLNPEDIFVVPLGCNQFYDNLPSKTKNTKPVFGIVANTSANKGGMLFLVSFALLKYFIDFELKVVSPKINKNKFFSYLISFLGLKNKIEIIGELENLNEFYKKLDYLVLPSKNEAFGLVVIEAMSFGIPCIVSSTAGVVEILNDENSLIFNRKCFINLLKQILHAIHLYNKDFKNYQLISEKAFELSKKYTWNNYVSNIINNL